jgi:diguanylate cyclase (GGDEF)-like protein/PAS domain S-box-containing protein
LAMPATGTKVDLDSFLAQVADAVMLTDCEGRIIRVNHAFEELTGYSAQEVIGQTRELLSSGTHSPEVFAEMDATIRSGKPFRIILTNRKKSGELYQEGIVVSPIKDDSGEIAYYFSMSRAIMQSRATYDNFTLLANASPVGIYLLQDSKFCFVNEVFVRETGYQPEELIGKSWHALVDREDWRKVSLLMGSLGTGTDTATKPMEYRIRVKSGAVRWVLESMREVAISGFGVAANNVVSTGKSRFVSGTFIDLTDRKQAEADLTEALSLYTATAEATADGIIIIRSDRTILGCNRRFSEMWGLEDIKVTGNADGVYAAALAKLKDPDAYRQHWAEVHTNPLAEAKGLVEIQDGRVFEAYSRPLLTRGEPTARVWSWRDVTQQHELEEQLRHQAFHDSLTGLANRARFMERLEHALVRASRTNETLALLFLDVDGFKAVNDTFGHPLGDELLQQVAQRIQACVRIGDTVARFGGDEFAVLLEDIAGVDDAKLVANKILEDIGRNLFLGERELRVGASGGLAVAASGIPDSDELLRRADVALYIAKAHSRGSLEVYEESMHTSFIDRLRLATDVRGALERGEFYLLYQPIVELATRQIEGVEALLRWNHAERGLIMPDTFIALAEETGAILDIGAWVLREACRQAKSWHDAFPREVPLRVSVNLSTRQIEHPDIVKTVERALCETGLCPGALTLEVTESIMLINVEENIEKLRRLAELGVSIALDDFGTGYSSLSYLQRLPVNELKVDKSFVDNLPISDARDLTRVIIEMGQALNMHVVAEGIEREDQLAHLRGLDCELGQGYLFSRPVQADRITKLLESRHVKRAVRAA